ncbi:MAG: Na(+)-translocating NADH-quinone reductase subunit C [Acidobacteriota bacterium]|nr:Na(+)-translocating NADH-quinone reductase subunit C [Acidobacteriota bacterium]
MQHSVGYTILFAGLICVACAVLVSSSAVSLSEMQQANAALDKRKNVLLAAGLARPTERLDAAQVQERFRVVKPVVVDLQSGEEVPDIDPSAFDQRKARNDPDSSREAPPNDSSISRLPNHAVVYQVLNDSGELQMVVLPIEGYGLWSTLYGFLSLDADTRTVRGLTYYQHGETPGLGGEVDNPRWKARWPGRLAFDGAGQTVIEVIKGQAGPPEEDPHRVDGLAGATITSRGVTNMLRFWLGENGFGPFLKRLRDTRKSS